MKVRRFYSDELCEWFLVLPEPLAFHTRGSAVMNIASDLSGRPPLMQQWTDGDESTLEQIVNKLVRVWPDFFGDCPVSPQEAVNEFLITHLNGGFREINVEERDS